MMGQWGGMGWGMGWGMGVLWLLLLGGIVIAVIALVRTTTSRQDQSPVGPPPVLPPTAWPSADRAAAQAILDERLARGEIDIAEFAERSRALRER